MCEHMALSNGAECCVWIRLVYVRMIQDPYTLRERPVSPCQDLVSNNDLLAVHYPAYVVLMFQQFKEQVCT